MNNREEYERLLLALGADLSDLEFRLREYPDDNATAIARLITARARVTEIARDLHKGEPIRLTPDDFDSLRFSVQLLQRYRMTIRERMTTIPLEKCRGVGGDDGTPF